MPYGTRLWKSYFLDYNPQTPTATIARKLWSYSPKFKSSTLFVQLPYYSALNWLQKIGSAKRPYFGVNIFAALSAASGFLVWDGSPPPRYSKTVGRGEWTGIIELNEFDTSWIAPAPFQGILEFMTSWSTWNFFFLQERSICIFKLYDAHLAKRSLWTVQVYFPELQHYISSLITGFLGRSYCKYSVSNRTDPNPVA